MFSTFKKTASWVVQARMIISLWALVLGGSVVSCTSQTVGDQRGEAAMPGKSIEEVLQAHTDELMSIPGVVGTGQGLCEEQACIKVYVVEKTPELTRRLPKVLEGYPVEVETTGPFRALPKN